MRRFSVRPAVTLKGRKFNGLRGFAGKPFHPPLTDIPIGAYLLAAVFDVISVIGGKHTSPQSTSGPAAIMMSSTAGTISESSRVDDFR